MILELINMVFQVLARAIFGVFQAMAVIVVTLITQAIESKTFNSYVELSRPGNSLLTAAFVAIVAFISGLLDLKIVMTAAAVATLLTAGGNAINDYYDQDIDAINKPKRPIPSKRVSAEMVLGYSFLLFTFGFLMSLFLPFLAILITVFNIWLLWYYASHLKQAGFVGNLSVAYLSASTFLFAAAVVGNTNGWIIGIALAVCAMLVSLGREIAKDMEDVKGDLSGGAKTLPMVLGMKKSAIVAGAFLIVVVLLSYVPYFLGLFMWTYIPIITLADIIFLYSTIKIFKKPNARTAAKVQKLLKMGMFIALLAFILGANKVYELVGALT